MLVGFEELSGASVPISVSGFKRGFSRNGGGGSSSLMGFENRSLSSGAKLKRFTRGHRSDSPRFYVHSMKLKSSLLLCLAPLILATSTGCNLFRKNKKPKENPAIASEVEALFRERWVDQRVPELTATGMDAAAARSQAEADFYERYPYVKKPKR